MVAGQVCGASRQKGNKGKQLTLATTNGARMSHPLSSFEALVFSWELARPSSQFGPLSLKWDHVKLLIDGGVLISR